MIPTLDYKALSNLRVLLHDHLYDNPQTIQDLMGLISSNFDLFSIDYDQMNMCIVLKLKKTNMKKNEYCHSATQHYPVFNKIFVQLFSKYRNILDHQIDYHSKGYGFTSDEINILLDPERVALVYQLTAIMDSILVIYL